MKSTLKTGAAVAVLLSSLGYATAQTTGTAAVIELSPEQQTRVYQTITRQKVRVAPPADVRIAVGAALPESVELYEVPDTVDVAPVRRYRYTVVEERVVLVDPSTRRVVRIIEE